MHKLSWGRAHDLPQGRRAVGGLSAECSGHVRPVSRKQRHGTKAWAAQHLSQIRGLHPRLCTQQGRPAGGGQLSELPRIAPYSEPQESGQPHVQDEHPQYLRNVSRQDQHGLLSRRAWQGDCRGQNEGAGLLRLPHGPRDSAAYRGRVPHAVHAHLRVVPQGQVIHLPRHVPFAARAVGNSCSTSRTPMRATASSTRLSTSFAYS